MYKVSIVMPMYNQEKYIAECLNSVINQTLQDIEIIVVNDGSTDKSLEIVQSYAQKDSRIIVIDKPNSGYGHSINVGVERATGEYIGIVETDDFVRLNMYEELYNTAKNHGDVDIVKSNFCRFFSDLGKVVVKSEFLTNDESYYDRVIVPREEKEVFTFPMNTWTGIYRREFLLKYNIKHNITPGASYQDNGFFFMTFALANSLVLVNKAFYMNRRDNPNSSVYNPEKVYCVCDEYDYINKQLSQYPDIYKQVCDVYWLKKWHNYDFTLTRIAYMYKLEFAQKVQKEFATAIKNGEIEFTKYNHKMKDTIDLLIKSPEDFLIHRKLYGTQSPKITAIVAKTSANISKTVASLGNQSFCDIEIYCVGNEFSKEEIEFFNKDSRVSIICDSTSLESLIFQAIKKAKGNYVHILTSNIVANADLYKGAISHIERHNVDMFVCGIADNLTDGLYVKDNKSLRNGYIPSLVSGKNLPKLVLASGWTIVNKIVSVNLLKAINNINYIDNQGNGLAFVTSIYNNVKKAYLSENVHLTRLNNPSQVEFSKVLQDIELAIINQPTKELQTNVQKSVAEWLYSFLQTNEYQIALEQKEKLQNILRLDNFTREDFENTYIYDYLLNFFNYQAEQFVGYATYYSNALRKLDLSNCNLVLTQSKPSNESNAVRQLQQEIVNIKKSYTYRAGRIALILPRIVRKIWRSIKYFFKNGSKSAIKTKRIDKKGCKMLEKNQPLVSIILPMYNMSLYINQCLDSLLNQTYNNLQIICVDDGSTDNTCQLVEEYIQKGFNVSLIRQEHKYAGSARNLGFQSAKGKYTIFLDSDDFFHTDFIKTMVARAEATKAEIVVCRSQAYDNFTGEYQPMKWTIAFDHIPAKIVFNGRQLKKYALTAFMGWAWDKLYLTEFIKNNNLYFQDLRSSNDLYFTFNSILLADKITVVNKILINQRKNHNSSISQTRYLSYNNCFLAADKLYETWKSSKYWNKDTEQAFCNWVANFFVWHYSTLPNDCKQEMQRIIVEYANKYKLFTHKGTFYYKKADYKELKRICNV